MRVTLVGPFPPQAKGEAHYLGEFATALRARGDAELSIVSQYWEKPFTDCWNGFEVNREFFDRSLRASFASNDELVDAILRTRPSIVHVHYGPNTDYGGRLGEPLIGVLRRIRRTGIGVVLTLHSLWLPQDAVESPSAQKLPKFARALVPNYVGWLMRSLRRNCDAFACLVSAEDSPATREFAQAYGLDDVSEEVHGCKPRFAPPGNGPPLIFSFGFLRPDKGFEYLIDAFAAYAANGGTGRLLVVGRPQNDGDLPYVRHLQAKAAQIPNERCRIDARYCSEEELEGFLRSSSLIVLPYVRNVGASGPLHHAMGAGRPIVATNVGHNRALAGIVRLVEPKNAAALYDAMASMLANESQRASDAQRVCSEAMRRQWSVLAARYSLLYERTLRSGSR
jgi:glycosyltransferase involved in cell wall biosynthesis